jgi:uncharacterized membrane protein (UPF0127 family)
VRILLAGALAVITVACAGTDRTPSRPPSTVTFDGSDAVLHVDVADTAQEQQRGLMGVETLPADEGMAFVFDGPADSTFWMKDTFIPLSVVFVDDTGRVIGMRDMQPCKADPCPTYGIDEPYVLAIEANLGWFREQGIEPGDPAELRVAAYG